VKQAGGNGEVTREEAGTMRHNRDRKLVKGVSLLLSGATLLGLSSCLGMDLEKALRLGAFVAATEFVIDNPTVLDLFPDGGTGAG